MSNFQKEKVRKRGQALVLFVIANKKINDLKKQNIVLKEKILYWCYKNNTIPMKKLY
jgi:hypothetical protein